MIKENEDCGRVSNDDNFCNKRIVVIALSRALPILLKQEANNLNNTNVAAAAVVVRSSSRVHRNTIVIKAGTNYALAIVFM